MNLMDNNDILEILTGVSKSFLCSNAQQVSVWQMMMDGQDDERPKR